MKILKLALTAALVALPVVFATAPVQALTAKQYSAQGRGEYISSKGRKMMRPMTHRRTMRHHRARY